ncbi:MAG: SPOR domain-containing protein [Pseudomonadota bacterium]
MAKSISDEELQLKKRARRRLVGAIAMVGLAVVLLPMVLDEEPKPLDGDIEISIPSPSADGFHSKVAPPPPMAGHDAATSAPQPSVSTQADAPDSAHNSVPEPHAAVAPKQEDQPESRSEPKPAPKQEANPGALVAEPKPMQAAPAAAVKKDPARETYVVQVGTYANPDNAKQAYKKITAAGMHAYTEIIKMPGGNKTRVRAGPFATREAAEKANDKLKGIGLSGPIAAKPVK